MSEFEIDASRYVLGSEGYENEVTPALLNVGHDFSYVIPIYQRPYAWSEKQINQFIRDVFKSFTEKKEPMFIGTMQLAKAENNQQDIIDGQQRFTTFLLLFKVLEQLFPESVCFNSGAFNRLITKVNNGEQQVLLNEFKTTFTIGKSSSNNIYSGNAELIYKAFLDSLEKSEEFYLGSFPHEEFHQYLTTKVYFVVIETHAGLSKTLKIFDTINTAGLPLDTNDLFKIRMYEYLQKFNRQDFEDSDEAFEAISALYECIDHFNKEQGTRISMQEILGIYQIYLIAKFNLPRVTYTFAVDTFYERLFETLFNINKWPNFSGESILEIKLDLQELKGLIDARLFWQQYWHVDENYETAQEFSLYNLWGWTRYSRYRKYIYIFLYQFRNEKEKHANLPKFISNLTKLYILFSVNYQKVVNPIRFNFNNDLLKEILSDTATSASVTSFIANKLHKEKWERNNFKKVIREDVFSSYIAKNLLCRISAMQEAETHPDAMLEVKSIIFNDDIDFDIEHIMSQTKEDNELRDENWSKAINHLGNLVLLERKLNRSIKNRAKDKVIAYSNSNLSIVKRDVLDNSIEHDFNNWTVLACEKRTELLANRIYNFICPDEIENDE